AGAAAPVQDVEVQRVDAARLARTRRRGSLGGVLLAIVVVGALGFAWLRFFRDDSATGTGAGAGRAVVAVPGNLLPGGAGDLEAEAAYERWDVQPIPTGAPFEIGIGRGLAHSGAAALVARHQRDEDGSERRLAFARLAEPLTVLSGSALRLSGHVRTEGGGRVALRLRFTAAVEEPPPPVFTGTEFAGGATWQDVA